MRSMLAMGALSTVLLWAFGPAGACDVMYTAKVVGFDKGNTRAVIRVESEGPEPGGIIHLKVLDLATGKLGKPMVIRSEGEDPSDSGLRGKRWKKFSRQLEAQGFRFDPKLPAIEKTLQPSGARLRLRNTMDEDEMMQTSDLVAEKDGRTVVIKKAIYHQMPAATEMGFIARYYQDPARRYLIAIDRGACVDPPVWVFSVADIEAQFKNRK